MKRHFRDHFFVAGEGILTSDDTGQPVVQPATAHDETRAFRLSRLGPTGQALDKATCQALAGAMTARKMQPDSARPQIPAGFTYLGQFIAHDLTFDKTEAALGSTVSPAEMLQGRSPALDLDSLYGRGPTDAEDATLYTDGIRFKMGQTAATPFPDRDTNRDFDGFDLPRLGTGATKAARRTARIPDLRNDENLAVAQTHLAFMRFHNRVVDHLAAAGTPEAQLFAQAREAVVKHYQWMLWHDFLPRIVDGAVLHDVYCHGRKHFEVCPIPGEMPTMPLEFSVAAYRFGHSMVREAYEWNRVFRSNGDGPKATLELLFTFSGTSGTLSPDGDLNNPESGRFERLPSNWIANFLGLFDFTTTGRSDLKAVHGLNIAKRIDTMLVDPLQQLPLGAFGGRGTTPPPPARNLAFRNLTRAHMVQLASGQQMAKKMAKTMHIPPLTARQILYGSGGANLQVLTPAQQDALVAHTPLWFYILREAELHCGRLAGVGARIVAEVFHRAIEGSQVSLLRDPAWRPTLGPDCNTFRMVDLLLFAYEGKAELLNPLGN